MEEQVYSLCFMCSVRCPIAVTVQNGEVTWIQGNPHAAGIEGSLCPRGAAGIALLNDHERLQTPMIRKGPRGSGRWRKVSWEEAFDYIAEKLTAIKEKYGPESIAFGERANLSTHAAKTFMKALGSPNHFTHDALCKGSVNTACRSLFGYTDAQVGIDYKNTKHMVLYGRNLFEAISVKEVKGMMEALGKGAKITCIDPRVTKTATRASRYWMIRPATDLALNYALIQVILEENLYDKDYVNRWVLGLDELREFVRDYTPEWAENETGIPADEIREFIREIARDRPSVVFHFGYRGANYKDETYVRRSILILNALMGSVEAKGGIFFKKTPAEIGAKPARKLTDQQLPKIGIPRFDKVGTKDFPLPDASHGVASMFPHAVINEDPYPVKALLINRFEPLHSIPDANLVQEAFDKLELIVTIDINYSDTAWVSDVVLPESLYLERTDCIQQANGLKPGMFLRRQAVKPRYDTMESAMMIKHLAKRMGMGAYFPYESMEELVRWQLAPTGFTMEDFAEKGFVYYTDEPIFWNREEGLRFKTPSGKIEFVSSLLEKAGFPSFPEYVPRPRPNYDTFRLTVGRCAVHTHMSTQNNLYLNEIVPENVLWINSGRAKSLGIRNGEKVEVSSSRAKGEITAYVTDMIHREAVFMLHGFGQKAEPATRKYKKGLSDNDLMESITDMVGGSPALHETFVQVRPVS